MEKNILFYLVLLLSISLVHGMHNPLPFARRLALRNSLLQPINRRVSLVLGQSKELENKPSTSILAQLKEAQDRFPAYVVSRYEIDYKPLIVSAQDTQRMNKLIVRKQSEKSWWHLIKNTLLGRDIIVTTITREKVECIENKDVKLLLTDEAAVSKKLRLRYERDHKPLTPISISRCIENYVLERIRDEWIRYAVLCKTDRVPYCMFSKPIDDFWHAFLLFTKDYEVFCKSLPNSDGTILHHVPHESPLVCPQTCQWVSKKQFIDGYKKLYGDDPTLNPLWHAARPCKATCVNPGAVEESSGDPLAISAMGVGAMAMGGTTLLHNPSLDIFAVSASRSKCSSCSSDSSSSSSSTYYPGCSGGDGGGGCGGGD